MPCNVGRFAASKPRAHVNQSHKGSPQLAQQRQNRRFPASTKAYPTDLRRAVVGRRSEKLRELTAEDNLRVTYNYAGPSMEHAPKNAAAALDEIIDDMELDKFTRETVPIPTHFQKQFKQSYTSDVVLKIAEEYDVYITVRGDAQVVVAGRDPVNVDYCALAFRRAMSEPENLQADKPKKGQTFGKLREFFHAITPSTWFQ
ncbi:hypothetical protein AAVH_30018 [Aphelenchoides avenae]|nr:hypothetical protein AAVH_30018 [Aphelenchus avenae]